MKIIRGLHNLPNDVKKTVLTIGNFDGVHLGHQALLRELMSLAHQLNASSTLMFFEPQPQEFFAKSNNVPNHYARLMSFRDKCLTLSTFPIDYILCMPFNAALAEQTADAFIQHTLVAKLHVKHLVVGDDFRFGKARVGDFHMLQQAGLRHGFSVSSIDEFIGDGERVSSTRIRRLLKDNQIKEAAHLLNRPFTLSGRVVHGDERGRLLNTPTANIPIKRGISPLHGVYAVRIIGLDQELTGVANIGTRPTVAGQRWQLEVHIFDFNQMIYGHHLTIEFCQHLRDEKKFNSLDELKTQIQTDCAEAKHYFANLGKKL